MEYNQRLLLAKEHDLSDFPAASSLIGACVDALCVLLLAGGRGGYFYRRGL